MKSRINEIGRDDGNIRLFLFRLKKSGLTIYRVYKINQNIYVLDTKFGLKVLKRFQSKSKLLFQFTFSQKMLKRNARILYYFERFPNGERFIQWNRCYWAMLPYISGKKVNFAQTFDQIGVFQALHDFHQHSFGIHMDVFPVRRLYSYYEQRFQNFSQLITTLPHVQMKMFGDILEWGLYALAKLADEKRFLDAMEKMAIVQRMWMHGDVAHHNFLRVAEQRVVLIDFDQVSIGPKEYDELQLSQRILCSNNWNFAELLRTIKPIQRLADQRWYLYGLIFPNDIYREWTLFFQGKTRVSFERLIAYTNHQYAARLKLIKELIHIC